MMYYYCQAEYHIPVTNPREESKHFFPLHLGIAVTKENRMQFNAGWNRMLLTQGRDRAKAALIVGVGPQESVVGGGVSRWLTQGNLPMCTLLLPQ